jgi:ribosomal protein S4
MARRWKQLLDDALQNANDAQMQYPGYLLNPGDMFSVDPEMVLFATGTPDHSHRTLSAPGIEGVWYKGEYIPPPGGNTGKVNRSAKSKQVDPEEDQIVDEVAEVEEEENADSVDAEAVPASAQILIHKALVTLRKDVKNTELLTKDLSAKRKQDLRSLAKDLRTAISKSNSASGKVTEDMQKHWEKWFYDILKAIPGNVKIPASVAYLDPAVQAGEEVEKEGSNAVTKESVRPGRGVTKIISEHLEKLKSYPNSKPRWFPRHYMSAFAFIPRYLEVNQNVCSAVYLRHPVARPGLAEVPSPFGAETGLLAFQWYLRRR